MKDKGGLAVDFLILKLILVGTITVDCLSFVVSYMLYMHQPDSLCTILGQPLNITLCLLLIRPPIVLQIIIIVGRTTLYDVLQTFCHKSLCHSCHTVCDTVVQ